MAGRPQSYCRDCGRQWFVTTHAPAARCPACRGPRVEAVLSLDDAEPAPPPPPAGGSALPLLLGLGVLGMALLGASGVAVYLLWDRPPRQTEQAAAPAPATPTRPTAATPAPPTTAPPAAPARESEPADPPAKTPEPKEPVARPNESGRTAPAPDAAALTPRPAPAPDPMPAPKQDTPPAPTADAQTPGATTPKVPPDQPRPRPAHPFPPPPGSWVSPWEKLGDVRVRVCGVAVANVPVERRKQESMSKDRYFVVWLDIENVSATAHTYRRWQPVLTGECTLKYANGAVVPYPTFPPETGRLWFADFNQPIPPGGPPLLESLAFARPDVNTPGDLTLTLDAARVGGAGRYSLTIPHAVWARP